MVDLSQKLCLLRRTHKEDLDSDYDVTPITDYIQTSLAITLRNQDARQQIELYRTCTAIPSASGVSRIALLLNVSQWFIWTATVESSNLNGTQVITLCSTRN
jgi:hypothetical protein